MEFHLQPHVVVLPYPSQGHINPMINLSNILVSQNSDILVTFLVTHHCFSRITSNAKPHNITFAALPDLHPSADTFEATIHAVMTQMEGPLQSLLDRLHPPPTLLICDAFLSWAVALANRRKIPVAAFWTTSTAELWLQYFHLFQRNQLCRQTKLDYIPSTYWIDGSDYPLLNGKNSKILQWALKSCEWLPKAQYLLLPSIYELESKVVDAFKANLSIPIYTIGPNIPYSSVAENSRNPNNNGYMEWLDRQPPNSVLYISHGSYLSISSAQMEEIAIALHDGNVRFMWVTREESPKLREICNEKKMGLVVAWCDQLRVLLHHAVAGYWTHCGWNSVMEGIFSGLPFLTFPIALDQPLISRLIVQYWKVGWRVKKDENMEDLVTRDVIVVLLRKFMDLQSDVGSEIRRRAKELQRMVQLAISENGSSHTNIRTFLDNIVQTGAKRLD
ncbi:hypothetical protein LR48_Vigan09g130900 [Vigna angularis]|uniref:UDP-glycosyltransferase protein n=2 Tax=Phaseolus angularis TaxID=3914 RepID=A0A0L9VC54_PHAAN|nr:UDP-glycosyltransferase 87A1 [Vigna angularis]KAG2394953.1 UDP-glycosyltransferase protein [Vigna angularis]KOM52650.1 hypothetical protein LR48_Vigan09g130900 [Vigna angularis]